MMFSKEKRRLLKKYGVSKLSRKAKTELPEELRHHAYYDGGRGYYTQEYLDRVKLDELEYTLRKRADQQ